MALQASMSVLNLVATGKPVKECSSEVVWENLGRLKKSRPAAFRIRCGG